MKVGAFKHDVNGTIHGKIQALGLGNLDAVFEERKSKKEEIFYKIIADPNGEPFEIGSAWPKEKSGLHYFSVSLDAVFSTAPINAALFPDKADPSILNLVWNKKSELEVRPETTKDDQSAQSPKVATVHKPKEPKSKSTFRRGATLNI